MYDIIGDIHGHADELEALLQKMGYRKKAGIYRHPKGRTAVFVGDYIDRGPKIRETLHLVRDMCEAGSARAVMGNHEFNALCFHTPDTEEGGYFRKHSLKNIEQHLQTLRAFRNIEREWGEFLEWFKSLPLYLYLGPFRVVHACWDPGHIRWLDRNYNGITPELLRAAVDKENGDAAYVALEETLKGKEHFLPDGVSFTDKNGHLRRECRVKWWTHPDRRETYKDILMECPPALAGDSLPATEAFYTYAGDKPIFFGHYWLNGKPMLNHSKAVCLDYSVAQGGQLVAYRWDGSELSGEQFIQ